LHGLPNPAPIFYKATGGSPRGCGIGFSLGTSFSSYLFFRSFLQACSGPDCGGLWEICFFSRICLPLPPLGKTAPCSFPLKDSFLVGDALVPGAEWFDATVFAPLFPHTLFLGVVLSVDQVGFLFKLPSLSPFQIRSCLIDQRGRIAARWFRVSSDSISCLVSFLPPQRKAITSYCFQVAWGAP